MSSDYVSFREIQIRNEMQTPEVLRAMRNQSFDVPPAVTERRSHDARSRVLTRPGSLAALAAAAPCSLCVTGLPNVRRYFHYSKFIFVVIFYKCIMTLNQQIL